MTRLPIEDPELVRIVTMLRAVDADGPPAHIDVDDLLLRARRAERRRRAGWWTAGVSAAAAASVAIAVPAVARLGGLSGVPAPAGSATTSLIADADTPSTPASTPASTPPPGASPTSAAPSLTQPSGPPSPTPSSGPSSLAPLLSLPALFGPDWSTDGALPGGFGGDLALIPGSPSAQGLPDGYRAAVRSIPVSASDSSNLDGFCRVSVEKGATSSACQDLTTPDGVLVHRVDVDAPNLPIGTWATLRLIHERPGGALQIVDVIVSQTGSPTTAAQRTQAHLWLERQLPTMEKAVTGLPSPALTKS